MITFYVLTGVWITQVCTFANSQGIYIWDLCILYMETVFERKKKSVSKQWSLFNKIKEMATHSSILAWKIPWMEEPGRPQSMGSQRVGHDWATSLSFTFMHWRRKWQPTPVFLPGKSHGWKSMVGYSPWGRKESDMTERLHFLSLSLW